LTEEQLGPEHPELAMVLHDHAVALKAAGRGREAKAVRKRAETIGEKARRENALGVRIDWTRWKALHGRGAGPTAGRGPSRRR
jgi:hypothetical protein